MSASAQVVQADVVYAARDTGVGASADFLAAFDAAWPSYRDWFLRDGEEPRATYADSYRALVDHMPELLPTYELLVGAVGGGDLQARFLSQWCPPSLFAACSMIAWPTGPLLLRNYDYPPAMCDTTVLASTWDGARVMGMADCGWGLLDGVNGAGLSVAIAFGGRPAVGPGFGIGLIVRYLLQTCRTVAEAISVLDRVPVSMCYNVALLDAAGAAAVVYISPDRPLVLADGVTAANRQGTSEWPAYEEFCGTVEREGLLAGSAADPGATAASLIERLLAPPVYRSTADSTWGTIYTTVYDPVRLTMDLLWPGASWRLSLWDFEPDRRTRRLPIHVPPAAHVQPAHGPQHRPLLIA